MRELLKAPRCKQAHDEDSFREKAGAESVQAIHAGKRVARNQRKENPSEQKILPTGASRKERNESEGEGHRIGDSTPWARPSPSKAQRRQVSDLTVDESQTDKRVRERELVSRILRINLKSHPTQNPIVLKKNGDRSDDSASEPEQRGAPAPDRIRPARDDEKIDPERDAERERRHGANAEREAQTDSGQQGRLGTELCRGPKGKPDGKQKKEPASSVRHVGAGEQEPERR